jgi:hypothetical protein
MVLRKHPLPAPRHRSLGILSPQRVGKKHPFVALVEVHAMQASNLVQTELGFHSDSRRQLGAPILSAQAMAQRDRPALQLKVMHLWSQRHHQAKPCPQRAPPTKASTSSSRSSSARTAATAMANGRRSGVRALITPSRSKSLSSNSRYRTSSADRASIWLEALSWRSTARWVRKAFTSGLPVSRGWRGR